MAIAITRGVTIHPRRRRRSSVDDVLDALKRLRPGEHFVLERLSAQHRHYIAAVNHLLDVNITTAKLAAGGYRVGRAT